MLSSEDSHFTSDIDAYSGSIAHDNKVSFPASIAIVSFENRIEEIGKASTITLLDAEKKFSFAVTLTVKEPGLVDLNNPVFDISAPLSCGDRLH